MPGRRITLCHFFEHSASHWTDEDQLIAKLWTATPSKLVTFGLEQYGQHVDYPFVTHVPRGKRKRFKWTGELLYILDGWHDIVVSAPLHEVDSRYAVRHTPRGSFGATPEESVAWGERVEREILAIGPLAILRWSGGRS